MMFVSIYYAKRPTDPTFKILFYSSLPIDCLEFLKTGGVKVFSPISGVCYSLNLRTLISESDAASNITVNGVGGPLTSVNVVLNIEGRNIFHSTH